MLYRANCLPYYSFSTLPFALLVLLLLSYGGMAEAMREEPDGNRDCIKNILDSPPPAYNHAKEHMDRAIADLAALVPMRTVSTELTPAQMDEAVKPLVEMARDAGLENVQMLTIGKSMPFLVADWLHAGENAPTVLLYGHYDVVGAGDESEWSTNPFELTVDGDALRGRGTSDDYFAPVTFLAAVRAYLATEQKLPVNVKLVIEGEEELGSEHFAQFMDAHPEKVSADVVYVADSGSYVKERPGLALSARGIMVINLEISAGSMDNHGGFVGGAVPDPQLELYRLIGNLVDEAGRITVPGIYASVRSPFQQSAGQWAPSLADFRGEKGLHAQTRLYDQGLGEQHPFHHTWTLPSISVDVGGTPVSSIPGKVAATVSIRLVPDMEIEQVYELLKQHLETNVRHGLNLHITRGTSAPWFEQPMTQGLGDIARLFEYAFDGNEALFMHDSGTLPLLSQVQSRYPDSTILLYGAWAPDSNIHAANENISRKLLERIIGGTVLSWHYLREASPEAP